MRLAQPAFALLLASLMLWSGCASEAAEGDAAVAEPPSENAVRPDWVDDAVVYEVFVRDFTPEGTFQAMIPRLGELQELGVTTLWLMPIHPVGEERRKGELGSPYAVQDYFGVNPRFGTEEDFRALVDSVHARGMHLIIDLVANHTAWDNAWVEEHPEWYTTGADGEIVHPEGTDWTDVADLNYDSDALRAEMTRAMVYWVEEFGIDGYRCDVAEEVPLDFWEAAIEEVRAVKPVMMLAEGEDPALHRHGFDLTYSWELYGTLKDVWEGAPLGAFFDLIEEQDEAFPEEALRLRFITNHDETAWDAPPPVLFDGLQGSKAAAVLMLTVPGVPLLYNGQEVGVSEDDGFFDKSPIDWTQNPELRTFYKNLLNLYDRSAALRDGELEALSVEDGAALFERVADGESVLVAVNVRDEAATVSLPDARQGAVLTDVLNGGGEMDAGEALELEPHGFRVLSVER